MTQLKPEEKKALLEVLAAMNRLLTADGHVDYRETVALRGFIAPYVSLDSDCARLKELLDEIRDDGVITPEEGQRLTAFIATLAGGDSAPAPRKPSFISALFRR